MEGILPNYIVYHFKKEEKKKKKNTFNLLVNSLFFCSLHRLFWFVCLFVCFFNNDNSS